MKILTVSDLHLRISLYDQLAAAVAFHEPDVLALVGDFLDGWERRRDTLTAEAAALRLTELAEGREMVCVRGNHEDSLCPQFEATWASTGRPLNALHGSAVSIGGLTIVGFPCWMGDDEYYSAGRPLDCYLPDAWLPQFLSEAGESGRSLWLMHEPPVVELAEGWLREPEWLPAIEEFQPLVVVSGHDHTTPLKTGRWLTWVGRTQCVNVGQRCIPSPVDCSTARWSLASERAEPRSYMERFSATVSCPVSGGWQNLHSNSAS